MSNTINLKKIKQLLSSSVEEDILIAIQLSPLLERKARRLLIKFILNKKDRHVIGITAKVRFRTFNYRFSDNVKKECINQNMEFILNN